MKIVLLAIGADNVEPDMFNTTRIPELFGFVFPPCAGEHCAEVGESKVLENAINDVCMGAACLYCLYYKTGGMGLSICTHCPQERHTHTQKMQD